MKKEEDGGRLRKIKDEDEEVGRSRRRREVNKEVDEGGR